VVGEGDFELVAGRYVVDERRGSCAAPDLNTIMLRTRTTHGRIGTWHPK
jgi:hypothetical protein